MHEPLRANFRSHNARRNVHVGVDDEVSQHESDTVRDERGSLVVTPYPWSKTGQQQSPKTNVVPVTSKHSNKNHKRTSKLATRLVFAPRYLKNMISREYRLLNLHQRITASVLLALFIAAVGIQTIQPFVVSKQYELTDAAKNIIGSSRQDTTKYLKLSQDKLSYDFMVPETPDNNSVHGGRNASAYSTSLQKDATKGVTYTDTATRIAITVVPKFDTSSGQEIASSSIVYPSGADQLVYTHKYNGLKEDIIVPNFRGDTLNYHFELHLPQGAEARLDSQGNIGIYSADTNLFGDISFGSDKDKLQIESARLKAPKTNLIATIPSPIVKDAKKHIFSDKAHFSLSKPHSIQSSTIPGNIPAEVAKKLSDQATINSYQLDITTNNIKNLTYPISVDPTIQSMTASDFLEGSKDSNIDVDTTNNLITRGALTGGSIAVNPTNTSVFSNAIYNSGATVWNNTVYLVGGEKGANSTNTANLGSTNIVQQATINTSTHALGSFTNSPSILPANITGSVAMAYGGYMYVIGENVGGSRSTAVYYSKINVDGSLGAWGTPGTGGTLVTAIFQAGATEYNGYIYIVGGWTAATRGVTTVSYSQINADGTLGAWGTTSSLNTGRYASVVTQYNGYIYTYSGAAPNCCSATGEYAKVNSDGTLGAWQSLQYNLIGQGGATLSRDYAFGTAYNGYLYVQGGCISQDANGSCTTNTINDIAYAPIYADGSIGAWNDYSLTNSGSKNAGNIIFNDGYAYLLDGCQENTSNSGQGNPCKFGKLISNAQYLAVDQAGVLQNSWRTASNNFTTARYEHGSVAFNGYLYVIGGCSNVTCESSDATTKYRADVQYAPINSDGSLGTWSTGVAMPALNSNTAGRALFGLAVAGNYLYVTGGYVRSNLGITTYSSDIIYSSLNSNGSNNGWTAGSNGGFTGRAGHSLTIANNRLYAIGGNSGSGAVATIESADISGLIPGAFSAAGNTNFTARYLQSAFAYANRMYVSGGFTGTGTATSSIQYATINSNGSLGSWTTNSVGSPYIYGWGSMVIDRGFMYVYDEDRTANVYYAPISTSDGSVGNFVQTGSLGSAKNNANNASVIYNGVIYSVGGCFGDNGSPNYQCNNFANNVQYIHINNGGDGGTTSWTAGSTINPRKNHKVLTLNGFIYVLGGICSGVTGCSSSMSTQVQYGSITAATGAISWSTASNAISVRHNFGAFAYSGRLYVLGGATNSATNAYTRTIQYVAPDASTGNITSAWTTNASNLASDNIGAPYIGYNGYVYRIGGNLNASGVSTSTEYATINATTGAIGSSWTSSASLNSAVSANSIAINNGYLYSVGGINSVETAVVEYSQVQADHSLGTWNLAPSLLGARSFPDVQVFNGFMYAIDGYHAGQNRLADVIYAPFLSNGSLGQWIQALPTTVARADASGALVGGRVYAVGGSDNAGNPLSDVQFASLKTMSHIGRYTRVVDFDKGVKPNTLIVRGNALADGNTSLNYATNNNLAATYSNNQAVSSLGFSGANKLPLALGSSVSVVRYLRLNFIIDDTTTSIFPDSAGGQTAISDYDIYFNPNTGLRLRGGQTFTTQIDRGLDAQ
jgi:hypothetical protein